MWPRGLHAILLTTPPGQFRLLRPRNCIKNDTTRDYSDRRIRRSLWGLSAACAPMVCAVVPPAVASGPINRGVRVLDYQGFSTGFFGGHILLKVPSRIDYMKHATTSDHDDRRT